jgi:hypothetical protein
MMTDDYASFNAKLKVAWPSPKEAARPVLALGIAKISLAHQPHVGSSILTQ